jgi:hypothetical protein
MEGKFYTTEDLIKMAQLGNFGNFSPMLARAMIKLKNLEIENTQLKSTIESYQKIDAIKDNDDGDHTLSITDLQNNY